MVLVGLSGGGDDAKVYTLDEYDVPLVAHNGECISLLMLLLLLGFVWLLLPLL